MRAFWISTFLLLCVIAVDGWEYDRQRRPRRRSSDYYNSRRHDYERGRDHERGRSRDRSRRRFDTFKRRPGRVSSKSQSREGYSAQPYVPQMPIVAGAQLPPPPSPIPTAPAPEPKLEKESQRFVVLARQDVTQMPEEDFKRLVFDCISRFSMSNSCISLTVAQVHKKFVEGFQNNVNHRNGVNPGDISVFGPPTRYAAGQATAAFSFGRNGQTDLWQSPPNRWEGDGGTARHFAQAVARHINIVDSSAFEGGGAMSASNNIGFQYLEYVASVLCPAISMTTNFWCRGKKSHQAISEVEVDFAVFPAFDDEDAPAPPYVVLDARLTNVEQQMKTGCASEAGTVDLRTCNVASVTTVKSLWMVRADPFEADAWRSAGRTVIKVENFHGAISFAPFSQVFDFVDNSFCIVNPLERFNIGVPRQPTEDDLDDHFNPTRLRMINKQTLWPYAFTPVYIQRASALKAKPFSKFLRDCVTEAATSTGYYRQISRLRTAMKDPTDQRLPTVAEVLDLKQSNAENLADYLDPQVVQAFEAYYSARNKAAPLGRGAQQASYDQIFASLGGGGQDPFGGFGVNQFEAFGLGGIMKRRPEPLHVLLSQYMVSVVEFLYLLMALHSQKVFHGNMVNGVFLLPREGSELRCDKLKDIKFFKDFRIINNQFLAKSVGEWKKRVSTHALKLVAESKVFAMVLWESFCLPLGVRRQMDQVPVNTLDPQVFMFCHNVGNQLDSPGFSEGLSNLDPLQQATYLAAFCNSLAKKMSSSSDCVALAKGLTRPSVSRVANYKEQRV